MSPADPPYAYGSIVVVADMLDPRGRHPKDRPCVVVTQPGSTPEGWELADHLTRFPGVDARDCLWTIA